MPESAPLSLFSSETITSVAELWKLAACLVFAFVCYVFRTPISQILVNLRRIKSKNTEIELAPSKEDEAIQDSSISSPQKAVPDGPIEGTPETSDNTDSLFSEMFDAISRRDNDHARHLRDKWIERNPSERKKTEVLFLHLLCGLQKNTGAVHELEQLRQNEDYSDQLPIILVTLGEFYESIDQHARASQYFQEWEEMTTNPLGRANAVIARSRTLAKLESPETSLRFLQDNISRFEDHESLAQVYRQVAEVFRSMNNELMRCVALEKVVQYQPTDSTIRFQTAYAQASADLPHLSLNNYEKELDLNPSNTFARNNYAVQLASFGAFSKSVEQYERARTDGNSLAAANLAYLYIDKGLLDDAVRLLREAQKTEGYHENIDRALADLHKRKESEYEKLNTIRGWIPIFQKFFQEYADARLVAAEKVHPFAGSWNDETAGSITITQERDTFHAVWGTQSSDRKLEGVRYNNGAEIKMYKSTVNPFAFNEEPTYGAPQDALAYISEDGSKLQVLSHRGEQPELLSFRRIASK